ncbi:MULTISPECIES: hypothetical protein [Streptacidiphilus]|uniref:Uncharacterized protein n=1 Tax=Streptacidiphilus cavernicola TaxID=3342716 RepID=A0ABV6UPV3_9ACTN|nr:hypothetical protein [Streptacidiphilus jeojiense]
MLLSPPGSASRVGHPGEGGAPALAPVAQSGELRCVLVVDDFDAMTGAAMWDDVRRR